MKKSILFVFTIIALLLSSCSDFMEFPPVSHFGLDSVFSKYTYAEKLLFDMYSYPVPLNFDTRSFGTNGTRLGGGAFASAITDEGQCFDISSGYQVQRYYKGNVEPSTCASWSSFYKGEDDYAIKWNTIRKAYLLLENIDRVPDATFPLKAGVSIADTKARIKDEAKLMIALVYFEMWKRYGGVPIVSRTHTIGDSPTTYSHKRATLEETYNFISNLINEVIASRKIPARIVVPAEFGRFPLALAYGLKARMDLYAASPLFNTATPYSAALGANSNLICFMNYDRSRWKKVADAATMAIDYCIANGYAIVDNPTQRDSANNYTVANVSYPSKGNTELVWGVLEANNGFWGYYTQVRGLTTTGSYGYGTNLVPLNQIERYELKSNVSGQYKSWDSIQSFNIPTIPTGTTVIEGNKLVAAVARKPYEGLDPRFYASIAYNGMKDYGVEPFIDMADGWADGIDNPEYPFTSYSGSQSRNKTRVQVLHYVRKFTRGYEFKESTMTPINIYMRLAELYLIRAEALNEYSGPQQQVYDDLNRIRTRSGMPNVNSGVTQTEMRETIAHERSIEFFYEDQRWFDLRRTLQSAAKIPVGIYKPVIKKWYHSSTDAWPYKITYEKVLLSTRVWKNSWYMNPFPSQEVGKNYGLIQNPEW